MDAIRFDRLTMAFARLATRRSALALVAALGATALVAEEARAFCRVDGASCDPKGAPNGCCSGRCPRKKKRCRAAPGQETCTVDMNYCATQVGAACGVSESCLCFITTRGESFCGIGRTEVACDSDRQCVREVGRGARCIESGGVCTATPVCARKCPFI